MTKAAALVADHRCVPPLSIRQMGCDMMLYVNKTDYFVGAFVSTILKSSITIPAFFDAAENSKIIGFTTNLGDFNVYIKCTMNAKFGTVVYEGSRVTGMKADFQFTAADMDMLQRSFYDNAYTNYMGLVCTNEALTETKIAIIPYQEAMNNLARETEKGFKKIVVVHKDNQHKFRFYGVDGKPSENLSGKIT